MRLEGKVAIVTGGGTGLGAQIAKRLAEEGAQVVIAGRREANLKEAAAGMPAGMVTCCPADITKAEDCQRVVDTALGLGNGLHILVNNAGAADNAAPFADFPLDDLKAAMDINVYAPFTLMQLAIPHMIESGYGSIINTSSVAALGIIPASVGYCTTKRALIALTESAAVDYGRMNVRSNIICPGSFLTDMARHGMVDLSGGGDPAEAIKVFSSPVPLQRMADPREISGLVAFLASEDSSYINGATIPIDGGVHLLDPQAFALSQMMK